MITKVSDILEEYNLSTSVSTTKTAPSFQNEQEQIIYNLLILEPLSIDDIAKKLQKTSSEISITLSFLEIRSILRKVPN
jgi:predicted Rossmann fold nucleotide-binding protein DprA/Smf involved in DNA uptake